MSARMFRKALQQKEKEKEKEKEETHTPPSDSDSEISHPAPALNPFSLLDDGQDDSESNDVDGIEDNTKEENNAETSSNISVDKKDDHKRKKKKRGKQVVKHETSVEAILEGLSVGEPDLKSTNSADTITEELAFNKTKDSIGSITLQNKSFQILSVDPKNLKAQDELRRLYGSEVVNERRKSINSAIQKQRRSTRHGGRRLNLRKCILVSASEYWPHWDDSMSMELIETKDGLHFFRYTLSSSYMEAQRRFEAAKDINDLNAIAMVLAHYPYHVESLLVLADAYEYAGDREHSVEFLEKSLYALECAWHPSFNPVRGNCRLHYGCDANKPFFIALHRNMQSLAHRGCFRSALEVCKLLLSLDSDDPLGALFCIDYFALRSKQYNWLENFADQYVSDNSLWLFPNFSYSLAVARFFLENDSSREQTSKTNDIPSVDLLKQALMLHPVVLKMLVEKTPLKEAVWQSILKNAYFAKAEPGCPSLEHLIKIYIERSYLIWRLPELQKFLKDASFHVIESVEKNKSDVKDWTCVRKETFSSDKNEYAHLLLSNFSDSVSTLPPEELQHVIGGPGRQPNVEALHHQNQQQGLGNANQRNLLAAFLESMLPWVDYGPDINDERNAGDEQRGD